MAKKRSIEDTNIILAKNPKHLIVHKDEASRYLLSKEEQKLFHLDRWFRPKSHRRTRTAKDIACMKDFFTCGLNFIHQAYHSIRGTGNEDIVEVLKDKVAMRAQRPSAKPEELERSLEGKCLHCSLIHAQVSFVPSAKPRVLERIENSNVIRSSLERIEGDNQFSIKVYNMLLILSKMLTQIEIQSEDDEGYGHAELSEMTLRRMSLLRTEMEQEETLLIELISSECKSEFVSACDELRSTLAFNLRSNIGACVESLSSGNKKIYTAFQSIIEFMTDIRRRWHTFKPKFPSDDVMAVWTKNIQLNFDALSARNFALLENH